MAFENLSERLQKALKNLTGKGKISEADINDASREIRLALLEADVNFKVVKDFIKKIKKEALGKEVQDSLNPGQQIIKIVDDELTKMMGEEAVSLNKSPHIPTIIMMVGLQGTGKTTTVGKLANYLMKNEKARPLLIAGDIYRPAAVDQLKQIGQQLDVPVYSEDNQDVAEIVKHGLEEADKNKNDYVLIDTAGRLEIDEQLMDELKRVTEVAHPDNTLLVVDAMTGQAATQVAEGFNKDLDLTGIILTKLDGDTRGGAALSIRAVTGLPIIFTGQGEKLTDLSTFHPDRMASRILGMGVYSMTPEERENPDILNPSRRRRIAAGSGRSIAEVNRMIKQFKQSKEMMQKMTKGDMGELANLPGMNSPMGKMAMRSMNKRFKKNKKKRMKNIKRYRSK